MRSITDIFRWAAPLACILVGLLCLREAFAEHTNYLEYIAFGDHSGAEVPEIQMWLYAIAAVLLLAIGGFLGGWFAARRP